VLVEAELRHAVVAAHRSLSWHCRHDELTGMLHHHGSLAGKHAHDAGVINSTELAKATRIHRTAGRLKHSISGRQWRRVGEGGDDKVFFNDPWAGKVLLTSGSAAPSRDDQPDAWRFWSRRKEADEEDVKQEGANKEGEADEKEEAEEGKEEDADKEKEADESEGGECGIHDGDAAGSRGGREDFQLALRPLASLPELVFCISGCFARLQGAIGQEEDFVDCSSLVSGCQARYDQLLADDFDMLLAVRADRDRVRRCIAKLHCECHFRDTAVESDTDEDDDGRSSRSSGDSVFALPTDFVLSDNEGGNPRALRDLRGSVQSSKVHPCGIVAFR